MDDKKVDELYLYYHKEVINNTPDPLKGSFYLKLNLLHYIRHYRKENKSTIRMRIPDEIDIPIKSVSTKHEIKVWMILDMIQLCIQCIQSKQRIRFDLPRSLTHEGDVLSEIFIDALESIFQLSKDEYGIFSVIIDHRIFFLMYTSPEVYIELTRI